MLSRCNGLLWRPAGQNHALWAWFVYLKYMNEAVNDVRIAEHRALQSEGDDTLRSTRQMWLYGFENVPTKHALRFEQVRTLNLQTSRAWAIKEVFRSFWLCDTVKQAESYFDKWYGWAIRSRLGPVKRVARMCKSHLANILTYFVHRGYFCAVSGAGVFHVLDCWRNSLDRLRPRPVD
jgi:transposase